MNRNPFGPFSWSTPPRRVVFKEVFIGNRKPTDHFAAEAKVFIREEDLYDVRKGKRR